MFILPFGSDATSAPYYRSVRAGTPTRSRRPLTKSVDALRKLPVPCPESRASKALPWYVDCSETVGETPCTEAARCYSESEPPMLNRALVLATALVLFAPHARAGDARSEAKEQVEFGIKVAQNGLWKEAAYRWQKAIQIDPDVRGSLEQPGHRVRAAGQLRQGARGLREGCRTRPEEPAVPSELRPLQRNQ